MFSVDISHKEEIKTLFDHNLQFDYLINNAGVTMNKRFEEVTEEEYDQIMSINAKGPFLCVKVLYQSFVNLKVQQLLILDL